MFEMKATALLDFFEKSVYIGVYSQKSLIVILHFKILSTQVNKSKYKVCMYYCQYIEFLKISSKKLWKIFEATLYNIIFKKPFIVVSFWTHEN